jgi:membrane protein DedA with SNARE-associated domain
LLSGLAWDGVYIIIGMVAGTTIALQPAQMILYSLVGLTAMYLLMFGAKLIFGRRAAQY